MPELARVNLKDALARTTSGNPGALKAGMDAVGDIPASTLRAWLIALKGQVDAKAPLSHSHSGADITSGTVGTARLGSGTASSTTFLRGDSTWATVTAGATNLDALTDVIITNAVSGQVLKFNGTNWINDTDLSGGGGGSLNVERNDVNVVSAATVIDFHPAFNVGAVGTEANVEPQFGILTDTISEGDHTHVGYEHAMAEFSFPGDVSTLSGGVRYPVPNAATITDVYVTAGTPSTSGSVVVDVNRAPAATLGSPATLYTTQANRPTLPASSYHVTATLPNVTALANGDHLLVDVDSAGTGAKDVEVFVRYRYAVDSGASIGGESGYLDSNGNLHLDGGGWYIDGNGDLVHP